MLPRPERQTSLSLGGRDTNPVVVAAFVEPHQRAVDVQRNLQRGALVRRPDHQRSRACRACLALCLRPARPRPLPASHEVAALAALRVQKALLERLPERVAAAARRDARRQRQPRVYVVLRQTQPVEARDGRHDDRLVGLDERLRGSVPQRVEVVVDRAPLLHVPPLREALGNVQREVRDEELDAFPGEVRAELARHLRGERLVRHHHQRRLWFGLRQRIHHVRHHEGLAGAGGAAQTRHLARVVPQELDAPRDRGGLVAGRRERGDHVGFGRRASVARGASSDAARCPRVLRGRPEGFVPRRSRGGRTARHRARGGREPSPGHGRHAPPRARGGAPRATRRERRGGAPGETAHTRGRCAGPRLGASAHTPP